jgi:hypothetical protein
MCRVRTSRVRQEEHITIKSRLCVRNVNHRLESKCYSPILGCRLIYLDLGFDQLPPLANLAKLSASGDTSSTTTTRHLSRSTKTEHPKARDPRRQIPPGHQIHMLCIPLNYAKQRRTENPYAQINRQISTLSVHDVCVRLVPDSQGVNHIDRGPRPV